MAIDNELRKILLREQDLRFVTDTLSEYLGKKDEERKYYAEEARRERLKKEELALKRAPEREKFYYNVAPKSDWSPEFTKYVEDSNINIQGGEVAKLVDITDEQSKEFQSFPEFTLTDKPTGSEEIDYTNDILKNIEIQKKEAKNQNLYSKIDYLKNLEKQIKEGDSLTKNEFNQYKSLISGENWRGEQKRAKERYINENQVIRNDISSILSKMQNKYSILSPKNTDKKNQLIELEANYNENIFLQDDMNANIITYYTEYNDNNEIDKKTYEDLDGNEQTIPLTGSNKAYLDMIEYTKTNNLKNNIVPMFEKNEITYSKMLENPESFKRYIKLLKNKYLQGKSRNIPLYNIVDEVNINSLQEIMRESSINRQIPLQ